MIRRLLTDAAAMSLAALVVAVAVPLALLYEASLKARRCVASWF